VGDLKKIREAARQFAADNIAECAVEILEWHDTAILRDGKVRELAYMLRPLFNDADNLRGAESFINVEALKFAARSR
jgi:hypothetical protein